MNNLNLVQNCLFWHILKFNYISGNSRVYIIWWVGRRFYDKYFRNGGNDFQTGATIFSNDDSNISSIIYEVLFTNFLRRSSSDCCCFFGGGGGGGISTGKGGCNCFSPK